MPDTHRITAPQSPPSPGNHLHTRGAKSATTPRQATARRGPPQSTTARSSHFTARGHHLAGHLNSSAALVQPLSISSVLPSALSFFHLSVIVLNTGESCLKVLHSETFFI